MKLLNRKDFIEIDRPVVFSYFSDKVFMSFENLYIKYGSIWNVDFTTQNLLNEIWFLYEDKVWIDWYDNMAEAERILLDWWSIELDLDCCGRDWIYKQEQKFIVYEDKDILKLIEKLKEWLLTP